MMLCVLAGVLSGCAEPAIGTNADPDPVDIDEAKRISINEVMADNSNFVMGCMHDWVELYNDNDRDVRLTSYYLRKSERSSKRLTLDDYTIPAKGFLVIELTDESPFRLSKEGDGLLLISGKGVADELVFDASIGKRSWSHEGVCAHPTPGYPNTEAGYNEYLDSVELPGLRINEIVSSNDRYLPIDENYYDLVEIYNGTGAAVRLSDYWLSDKKSEPKRYHFPEVTLEAGGYYVVYCSGLTGEEHASFKISSSGETVYLSDGNGFVDAVYVPGDVLKNESYGRNGKQLVYMSEATPGAENAAGRLNRLGVPAASVASGAYDHELSVELSAEGTIYYTLDGTEPTTGSTVYTEPIAVDSVASIRTFCESEGSRSGITNYFYLVNINHAYPVVNVAIKQEYLDGDEGVLNHITEEYEHEAFVTMMNGGEECFSVPCGFKLHGNDSKKGDKQNFQLRFRSAYGASKLEYKVFENRDYEVYNSLILKGGSEDYLFCGLRDELCTGLVDGTTNLEVQAYRPVILYLNGQYWGFYWLRERYDTTYAANRLGVDKDTVNIVKTYGRATAVGSGTGFTELIEYCRTHDLTERECYEHVISRIDVFSLMDWYICRSYLGDQDLANVRMYNSEAGDGRWRWCFYDLDWALFVNTEDPIGCTVKKDGNHDIILALLKNPEFKDLFLKRYAYLMQSVLNENAIIKKVDELAAIMEPEIAMDREKYGLTVEAWRYNIENLKNYVRNGKRDETVLAGIKRYFGLSDAEMKAYFGK